jgi:16S rRNA U516 pseudouridylate synthase RsuA-like enzyme
MFEAVGHSVLKLVRIRIGELGLDSLPIGKHRVLSPKEAGLALSWKPRL